jgi:hypothetical protein
MFRRAWAPFTDQNTLLESPLPNAATADVGSRSISNHGRNRPEGNCQCRRWYDLFAVRPKRASFASAYGTRRHSISSSDQMTSHLAEFHLAEFHLAEFHLAEFHARPHGTGAVHRRCQRDAVNEV